MSRQVLLDGLRRVPPGSAGSWRVLPWGLGEQDSAASGGLPRGGQVQYVLGHLGGDGYVPKQTFGVGHLNQNQRAREQALAGSGNLRGSRQVLAGSVDLGATLMCRNLHESNHLVGYGSFLKK